MSRSARFVTTLLVLLAIVVAARLGLWWAVEQVASPSAEEGLPRLQLVTDEVNIGRDYQPDEVRFPIANCGTGRLVLRELPPDSLTDVALATVTIAAGQTGEFTVALNAETLSSAGKQVVWLETNDPEQPRIALTIRGSLAGPTPAGEISEPMAPRPREERSVLLRRP